MKQRILGGFWVIVGLSVFVGLPVWWVERDLAKHQLEQAAKTAAREEKKAATERLIQDFAASHDAVRDWRQGLSSFTLYSPIYSFQVEPVLLRYSGKRLLFIARLVNISEQGDKPILYFDAKVNQASHLRLELTSDAETASRIAQTKVDSEDSRFAVVAELESISGRPAEASWNEERQPISLAKGRCLDALYLGDYLGDFHDIMKTFKEPQRSNAAPQ